jgi:hypothetical protein
MNAALGDLSLNTGFRLYVYGIETYAGREESILVDTYFSRKVTTAGGSETMVDVWAYRGAKLQLRLVGDGVTFWAYEPARNQYYSAPYGRFDGANPGDYVPTLMNLLNGRARGDSAFPAKLLQQAFGKATPAWTPWPANATVTVEGNYVVCSTGQPVDQQVTYTVSSTEEGHRLDGVHFWSRTMVGRKSRLIEWTMQVYREPFELPEGVFKFVPPKGSRAISLPNTGGEQGG